MPALNYSKKKALIPLFASLGQGVCLAHLEYGIAELGSTILNSSASTILEITSALLNKNVVYFIGITIALTTLESIKGYYAQDLRNWLANRSITKLEDARNYGIKYNNFNNHHLMTGKTVSYSGAFSETKSTADLFFEIITSIVGLSTTALALGYLNGNLTAKLQHSTVTMLASLAFVTVATIFNTILQIYTLITLKKYTAAVETFDSVCQSYFGHPLKATQTGASETFSKALETTKKGVDELDSELFTSKHIYKGSISINVLFGTLLNLPSMLYGLKTGIYKSPAHLAFAMAAVAISSAFFIQLEKLPTTFFSSLTTESPKYFANFIKVAYSPSFDHGTRSISYNYTSRDVLIKMDRNFEIFTGNAKTISKASSAIEFREGKSYHLKGHSGAGKSTFSYALFNLTDLWGGRITYANELTDGGRLLPRSCQYVSQSGMAIIPTATLFDTLTSNLTDAEKRTCRPRLLELLRSFHIYSDYSDKIDQPILFPSGGQQVRLLMVKALLQNAKIIVVDEGLANVSVQYKDTYLQMLKNSGAAVIVAAHMEDSSWADYVVDFNKPNDSSPANITMSPVRR